MNLYSKLIASFVLKKVEFLVYFQKINVIDYILYGLISILFLVYFQKINVLDYILYGLITLSLKFISPTLNKLKNNLNFSF